MHLGKCRHAHLGPVQGASLAAVAVAVAVTVTVAVAVAVAVPVAVPVAVAASSAIAVAFAPEILACMPTAESRNYKKDKSKACLLTQVACSCARAAEAMT